jgi:hypothetical protein
VAILNQLRSNDKSENEQMVKYYVCLGSKNPFGSQREVSCRGQYCVQVFNKNDVLGRES